MSSQPEKASQPELSKEQEKKLYDKYWKDRGERIGDRCGYAPNLRRWMGRSLEGFDRSKTLLEVGCGDCQFTPDLAKFTDKMVACDISAYQIERNRAGHPEIQFFEQDLREAIALDDGTAGALWCSEVIEHLSQPRFALEEFYRVLEPGGRLLLTVPHHGRFKNVMIALFKWEDHFDPEYPHLQYFTAKSFRALTEKVGFQDVRIETCGMNKPMRDLLIPTNLLLTARKPA